jgi:hypothetical protein
VNGKRKKESKLSDEIQGDKDEGLAAMLGRLGPKLDEAIQAEGGGLTFVLQVMNGSGDLATVGNCPIPQQAMLTLCQIHSWERRGLVDTKELARVVTESGLAEVLRLLEPRSMTIGDVAQRIRTLADSMLPVGWDAAVQVNSGTELMHAATRPEVTERVLTSWWLETIAAWVEADVFTQNDVEELIDQAFDKFVADDDDAILSALEDKRERGELPS